MILERTTQGFKDYSKDTFVSTTSLIKLLEKKGEFKEDLLRIFKVDEEKTEVFKIGNSKSLIDAIRSLDTQCEKIDISKERKYIYLKKMLEVEKAIFEIFNITDDFILKTNRSDLLEVETKYSAKSDLLEYYNFSRFANYCRDNEYEDLIEIIKDYLRVKNSENNEKVNLRLVYKYDENKYYLRAITSTRDYRDYGINFSVFVALVSLSRYVVKNKNEIYIEHYSVSDSEIYVAFRFSNEIKLKDDLFLAVSLILENDEIKRSAVSFNGVCKLRYLDKDKQSEIYIKPKGLKKEGRNYEVDILTYPHRGSVEKVYEKIEELPIVIEEFINQVSEDAPKIASIKNPDDVRKLIATKVNYSKKKEFQEFKERIFKMLMKITVDNTFQLFELLREVDELFEHNDVVSRDFWRTKLYETLIQRE
jgi:hypothetical protein